MKLAKIKTKLFLSCVVIATFFTINEGNAGLIKINNHSRNGIEIDVVPAPSSECGSYCWKCLGGALNSKSQMIKEIIVPTTAFKGNEYFSVIGTEGGFLANGECANLSVLKNYEVSFLETSTGLRCESKII